MKRIVVISDLQCGHVTGLTHPDFNPAEKRRDSTQYKLMMLRRNQYKFYRDTLQALQPIYGLIVNGDAVEGKGGKSGATELITTDRVQQAEMAAVAILEAKAEHIFMSYGTPYHTGCSEDWEDLVAEKVKAVKIGGHDFVGILPSGHTQTKYDGLVFDYRHYIGRSIIPHGRHTAPARERLHNLLWNEHGEYPKAHVIVRSHVHYFTYCGGYNWLALTTPALQTKTKFGTRIASGTVDFGLIWFDVIDKDDFTWNWALYKPRHAHKEVIWI